jgi:hypothetical protein
MKYYDIGMYGKLFNRTVFWLWFLSSTVQSLIVTYFCIYSIEENFAGVNGQPLTFWTIGVMILGMVVMISNFKVMIISTEYSLGSMMITGLSIFLYIMALTMSTNIQYGSG